MKRFFILIRNTVLYLLLGAVLVTVAAGIKGINIGDIFSDNSDTGAPSEDTHIYLRNIEQGSCKKLMGNVACTVVFINDTESSWTAEAESEAKKALIDQEQMLEREAALHGVTLDINFYYSTTSVNVKIPIGSEDSVWLEDAVKGAGLDPFDSAPEKLKRKYSADEAPIVFAINKEGRSNAHQQYYNATEYCTVYESDMDSFSHELLHLFGANDYYYPSTVTLLCEQHLGDSIMNNGEAIDSLTAHVIGWTDEPDEAAEKFLSGSRLVSEATIEQAHKSDTITGFGLKTTSNGKYLGNMVYGIFQGHGTYTFNSGDKYEGKWNNGVMHGQGRYTFASGNYYEGEWVDGKKHGQGKYVWSDGTVYEGDFYLDVRSGNGKMTYPNGASYEGEWSDGKMNGQGKYTYSDGAFYEGAWVEDKRHGQGRLTYTDGTVYDGAWVEDVREGVGSISYASGGRYEGEWKADTRNGQGKYTWSGGSSYEGGWVDGKQHGQGKYTSAEGRVTVGTWEMGEFVK